MKKSNGNNTLYYYFYTFKNIDVLVAERDNRVCFAHFQDSKDLGELSQQNTGSSIVCKRTPVLEQAHEYLFDNRSKAPRVMLEGSEFQQKVWQALMSIPFGSTVSYTEVAAMINQPTAVRAVASAVAKNNVAYFIPCHRVVPASGGVGRYRWGQETKAMLLEREQALSELESQ
tara:strand:- start:67 stop:585 length:519 start_codon:yes stop_codon:yes gene_type:complete